MSCMVWTENVSGLPSICRVKGLIRCMNTPFPNRFDSLERSCTTIVRTETGSVGICM